MRGCRHREDTIMTIPEGSARRSATPVTTSGDLLTVEQAADYLNITDHFVRRLIRERRIPFLKVGRLVRLRRTDLEAYLAECSVPAIRR
jgi:excisionase family DNA binding protein